MNEPSIQFSTSNFKMPPIRGIRMISPPVKKKKLEHSVMNTDDIVYHIASFLKPEMWLMFRTVSKKWKHVVDKSSVRLSTTFVKHLCRYIPEYQLSPNSSYLLHLAQADPLHMMKLLVKLDKNTAVLLETVPHPTEWEKVMRPAIALKSPDSEMIQYNDFIQQRPPEEEDKEADSGYERHKRAKLGATKFGGLPHMPEHLKWPLDSNGKPLYFLLQLNLESVSKWDMTGILPSQGMLYFFWNPHNGDEGAVLFTESNKLQVTDIPQASSNNNEEEEQENSDEELYLWREFPSEPFIPFMTVPDLSEICDSDNPDPMKEFPEIVEADLKGMDSSKTPAFTYGDHVFHCQNAWGECYCLGWPSWIEMPLGGKCCLVQVSGPIIDPGETGIVNWFISWDDLKQKKFEKAQLVFYHQ